MFLFVKHVKFGTRQDSSYYFRGQQDEAERTLHLVWKNGV